MILSLFFPFHLPLLFFSYSFLPPMPPPPQNDNEPVTLAVFGVLELFFPIPFSDFFVPIDTGLADP